MMPAQLPESARKRLTELQLQRMASEDAARSANTRLNSLPHDAAPELQAGLALERDRHNQRFRALSALIHKVNEWIMRLPGNAVLEQVQAADITLKEGEPLPKQIGDVRGGIFNLARQLAQVKAAPLRRSDQQEAISAYLARLAASAAPKISFDVRGNARVFFADDVIDGKECVLSLLSWALGPQTLAAAFSRQLEQEPERADALSPAERERRTKELSDRLLEHEHREEQLLVIAENQGLTIERRPDADPRAVLGLTVVKLAQARAPQVA
jgi:hypothetical protein